MSETPEPSVAKASSASGKPEASAADPSSKAVKWVIGVIAVSLIWYLLADRFTPYTQQARVQAFVVPVAAEVSGRVTRVLVHNNQEVDAGQLLFEVDGEPYRIAADRARADLESMRRQIGASTAGIDSALAGLRAAIANEVKARQDSDRLERLYREDEGTVSLRRLEVARATHEQAQSQVVAARADLRTEVGQFAAAGSPVMTLIAIRDVWINADMTENNLGHLKPGTAVSIALDALPGEVFHGRVRSIGYGVSVGQSTPPGSLPTVQNSRDWLRPAQRFPVVIEFDRDERARLHDMRVGGQAEVMAFPSEGNLLNLPGRVFLRIMSWLSYLY
jgi:multidrug resistance efflux pump